MFQSAEGQMIEGWVTVTPLEDEATSAIYGIFKDKESAENWATNCAKGTYIRPIFTPAFNKG
jgi:hypothetical protein